MESIAITGVKQYSEKLEKLRLQLKSYGVSGSPGAADSDPLINRRMNARIGIRTTHNRSTVKKIHSFLTDST
jgi:hypothetical protein